MGLFSFENKGKSQGSMSEECGASIQVPKQPSHYITFAFNLIDLDVECYFNSHNPSLGIEVTRLTLCHIHHENCIYLFTS